MKKVLCLFLCLLASLSFTSCSLLLLSGGDDRADKEDIFAYVKENEDLLLKCIDENDFSEIKSSAGIIQYIDVDDIGNGFVNFDCGGAGFGPETSYRGFYYSADDDMTEVWCAHCDNDSLRESGEGYLWKESWTDKYGDNTYYTENICGHFYYYDASY